MLRKESPSALKSTPKGIRRKDEILAYALHLIARQGVAALSYESIAHHLKLSKAHVKYYFHTKEDLLIECFSRVAETGQRETVAAVERAHTWQARIMAVVEGAFNAARKNPEHLSLLFLFYHFCAVKRELAQIHKATREIGRARLRDMIMAGKKIGFEEADQVAFDIQMVITGALLEIASTGTPEKIGIYQKRVEAFVKRLI